MLNPTFAPVAKSPKGKGPRTKKQRRRLNPPMEKARKEPTQTGVKVVVGGRVREVLDVAPY